MCVCMYHRYSYFLICMARVKRAQSFMQTMSFIHTLMHACMYMQHRQYVRVIYMYTCTCHLYVTDSMYVSFICINVRVVYIHIHHRQYIRLVSLYKYTHHASIHTHTCTCMYTSDAWTTDTMHIYIYIHTTCIHTYIHTYIHTLMYTCIHTPDACTASTAPTVCMYT
jgi:hypothetical protein